MQIYYTSPCLAVAFPGREHWFDINLNVLRVLFHLRLYFVVLMMLKFMIINAHCKLVFRWEKNLKSFNFLINSTDQFPKSTMCRSFHHFDSFLLHQHSLCLVQCGARDAGAMQCFILLET